MRTRKLRPVLLHEQCHLTLLRPGGLIAIDNAASGTVALPSLVRMKNSVAIQKVNCAGGGGRTG